MIKKNTLIKVIIVLLIVILASLLVYVNQTPTFLTKTIKLFNKNYEYNSPSYEIENVQNTFAEKLTDSQFIISTQEKTEILSHTLKNEGTISFSGEKPTIKTADDKFLIMHANSNKALFTDNGKSIPVNCTGNILTGAVNKNGYFALVTEEKGFKAQIVVYNKSGKEIYKWHSAQDYITDIDISTSNNTVIASTINYDNSKLKSKIIIFNTSKELPEEISLDNMAVRIKFLEKSKFVVIGDEKISAFSLNKKELWTKNYEGKNLFAYKIKNGKIALALGTSNLSTETSTVYLLNDNGKEISSFNNKGEIVCLDILANDVLIAGKRDLKVADNKEKFSLLVGKDINNAMFSVNNKTVLVVTNSLAQIMYLK